jgi:transcriptional regulator with XRE-family HTH domain
MLKSAQIRAARALLDWRQKDISKASGVGTATIQRIEKAIAQSLAMFRPWSGSRQRSNKPEFNSSRMTRWAVSAFRWQRGREGDDGSVCLCEEQASSVAEPSYAMRLPARCAQSLKSQRLRKFFLHYHERRFDQLVNEMVDKDLELVKRDANRWRRYE